MLDRNEWRFCAMFFGRAQRRPTNSLGYLLEANRVLHRRDSMTGELGTLVANRAVSEHLTDLAMGSGAIALKRARIVLG